MRLIPKSGKRISSTKLADKIYAGNEAITATNARQSVVATMRGLIEKIQANKDGFVIEVSERSGPNPVEYWRVEK